MASATTLSIPRRSACREFRSTGLALGIYLLVGVLTFGIAFTLKSPSVIGGLAVVGFLATGTWMFVSERYERTLTVLLLYLGLLDGYLKLKTNASYATLGRDVLLYAICLGIVARGILRKEEISWPPLSGWVVALMGLCTVEVLNPGNSSVGHSISALRPHVEFVPLFFLGYHVLRTKQRLRNFAVLLLIVGAANGGVGFIQFGLTPDQLAGWGPGYSARIKGGEGSAVAARTFITQNGISKVRPFGLGGDVGAGGLAGLLALPAGVALLSLGIRRRSGLLAIPLSGGVLLAIVTSQGRAVVIGSVTVVLSYVLLTIVSKRLIPTLAGLIAVGLVGALVVSSLSGDSGLTSRYSSITPGKLLKTTNEDRGGSITLAPRYVLDYPVGAGLGLVGPAAGRADLVSNDAKGYNGETEFNFLLVELGVLGLILILGLTARVLIACGRMRRLVDPELRVLLAAIAAPLFGIAVQFFTGAPTSSSPAAPYYWFVIGALAFWLMPRQVDPPPAVFAARTQEPHEDVDEVEHESPLVSRAPVAPPAATSEAPGDDRPLQSVLLVYHGMGRPFDAIEAYTRRLANGLRDAGARVTLAIGTPEGWHLDDNPRVRRADEVLGDIARGHDAVIVQYNPFSYGRWGVAPWLPRRLAQLQGARRAPLIATMVHEAVVEAKDLRHGAMSVWQRAQFRAVLQRSDLVFAATETLAARVRRTVARLEVQHLPVGSNLPDARDRRHEGRERLQTGPGDVVLATFGTDHPSRLPGWIAASANAVAESGTSTVLLNLGANPPGVGHLHPGVRMVAPGPLEEEDLAVLLASTDVYLAAFADGISSRRTTFVAGAQQGLAIVAAEGPHTDETLRRAQGAFVLCQGQGAFVDASVHLAHDPASRASLGVAARGLYEQRFAWPVVAETVLSSLAAR